MDININDIKNGMTVIIDGNLCLIQEFQHVKPGKGPAFVRIKYRNLRTGATIEDTFNTRELFKIKVHLETSPEPPKEIAAKIAEATKCDVVQVVGGTIVLFRINLMLRQRAAEKKKRAKEKAEKEAIKRRTERKKKKYGVQ